MNLALPVNLSIANSQSAFAEFGGHPKNPDQNHPKNSARPANPNRNGHASDISDPHRGAQRRRKRLKMSNLPRILAAGILPSHRAQRQFESAKINETKETGQENRRDGQQNQHDRDLLPQNGHRKEDDFRQGL